jgi:hypothetical protein
VIFLALVGLWRSPGAVDRQLRRHKDENDVSGVFGGDCVESQLRVSGILGLTHSMNCSIDVSTGSEAIDRKKDGNPRGDEAETGAIQERSSTTL